SHDTWSGIVVEFPIEGSNERLATELSGLPVFDRDRSFRGYRGFGVCRNVARIAALMQTRRGNQPAPTEAPKAEVKAEPPVLRDDRPTLSVVPQSVNVVPFRSSAPPATAPSLTPVERTAFRELASRLTARLRNGDEKSTTEASAPETFPEIPTAV